MINLFTISLLCPSLLKAGAKLVLYNIQSKLSDNFFQIKIEKICYYQIRLMKLSDLNNKLFFESFLVLQNLNHQSVINNTIK